MSVVGPIKQQHRCGEEGGCAIPKVGDPERPPVTPASPGLPPPHLLSLFDPFLGCAGFTVEAPRMHGTELSSSPSFACLEPKLHQYNHCWDKRQFSV